MRIGLKVHPHRHEKMPPCRPHAPFARHARLVTRGSMPFRKLCSCMPSKKIDGANHPPPFGRTWKRRSSNKLQLCWHSKQYQPITTATTIIIIVVSISNLVPPVQSMEKFGQVIVLLPSKRENPYPVQYADNLAVAAVQRVIDRLLVNEEHYHHHHRRPVLNYHDLLLLQLLLRLPSMAMEVVRVVVDDQVFLLSRQSSRAIESVSFPSDLSRDDLLHFLSIVWPISS